MSGKGLAVQDKVPVSGQALVMGFGLGLSRPGLVRIGAQHWGKWGGRSYASRWELKGNPGR